MRQIPPPPALESAILRSGQDSPCGEITAEALCFAVGEGGQSPDVQVVFDVSQFHPAGDRMGQRTANEFLVGLALSPRDTFQRCQHFIGKALAPQFVEPPALRRLAVLDHIMQHRHDLLRLRFHLHHQPQRMEKVGLPRLVHGSFVREDDWFSSALGASGSCLTQTPRLLSRHDYRRVR